VRNAGYDTHGALLLLPEGVAAAEAADRITGHATTLLIYLDRWKPDAGLKPRPLDQATSSIKQFDKSVNKPIEQIEAKDVQRWIDGLINADSETGLHSKTVNRKLGEIRNYWSWLESHQIVLDDRNPFAGRRVINPPSRRKSKEELRQRFRPEDVVRCWAAAEQRGRAPERPATRPEVGRTGIRGLQSG
jgi:site-specific recombinase XerD